MQAYRILSSDSHVVEPPDTWNGRLPAKYRDRAPRLVKLANGGDGVIVEGRPLYVALSGGLDSTAIAVLARQLLGPFTAVTFAVSDEPSRPASDDLAFAHRVAQDLGVPLVEVRVTADDLMSSAGRHRPRHHVGPRAVVADHVEVGRGHRVEVRSQVPCHSHRSMNRVRATREAAQRRGRLGIVVRLAEYVSVQDHDRVRADDDGALAADRDRLGL